MQSAVEKGLHPLAQAAIVAVAALGGGGTAINAFSPFVSAETYRQDLTDTNRRLAHLERGLCEFRLETQRSALDSKLRDLNSQQWALERAIEAGTAGDYDVDLLHDIRNDVGSARRALNALPSKASCATPL